MRAGAFVNSPHCLIKNLTHIHSSDGGIGETDEVNFARKTGIDRKTGPEASTHSKPAGKPAFWDRLTPKFVYTRKKVWYTVAE
jgi:hypothetical protein